MNAKTAQPIIWAISSIAWGQGETREQAQERHDFQAKRLGIEPRVIQVWETPAGWSYAGIGATNSAILWHDEDNNGVTSKTSSRVRRL